MKILNLDVDDLHLRSTTEVLWDNKGMRYVNVMTLGDKLIGIPNKVVFDGVSGCSIADDGDMLCNTFRIHDDGDLPVIWESDRNTYTGKNILFTGVYTKDDGFTLSAKVNLIMDKLVDLNRVTLVAGGTVKLADGTSFVNLVLTVPSTMGYEVDNELFSCVTGKGTSDRKNVRVGVGALVQDI